MNMQTSSPQQSLITASLSLVSSRTPPATRKEADIYLIDFTLSCTGIVRSGSGLDGSRIVLECVGFCVDRVLALNTNATANGNGNANVNATSNALKSEQWTATDYSSAISLLSTLLSTIVKKTKLPIKVYTNNEESSLDDQINCTIYTSVTQILTSQVLCNLDKFPASTKNSVGDSLPGFVNGLCTVLIQSTLHSPLHFNYLQSLLNYILSSTQQRQQMQVPSVLTLKILNQLPLEISELFPLLNSEGSVNTQFDPFRSVIKDHLRDILGFISLHISNPQQQNTSSVNNENKARVLSITALHNLATLHSDFFTLDWLHLNVSEVFVYLLRVLSLNVTDEVNMNSVLVSCKCLDCLLNNSDTLSSCDGCESVLPSLLPLLKSTGLIVYPTNSLLKLDADLAGIQDTLTELCRFTVALSTKCMVFIVSPIDATNNRILSVSESLTRQITQTANQPTQMQQQQIPQQVGTFPSLSIIDILLQFQNSAARTCRLLTLDFWLDLQDTPISLRHTSLVHPLYTRILEIIITKTSYPEGFVSWDDEGDVDVDEFNEERKLATDVLVECYKLLRVNYLASILEVLEPRLTLNPNTGDSGQWQVTESLLNAICTVGREICARVKARRSRGNGTGNGNGSGGDVNGVQEGTTNGDNAQDPILIDRDLTAQALLSFTQTLCQCAPSSSHTHHQLVLSASARFLGSFAPVLNELCNVHDIYVVLEYLSGCLEVGDAVLASSTSIRALFLNCSGKLKSSITNTTTNGENAVLYQYFTKLINTTFEYTSSPVPLLNICEGCTRLCVSFNGSNNSSLTGLGSLCVGVVGKIRESFDVVNGSGGGSVGSGKMEVCMQRLARGLMALSCIVKYLDGYASQEPAQTPNPLLQILDTIYPPLKQISNHSPCRAHADVIQQLLSVNEQILKSFTLTIEQTSRLNEIINTAVVSYQETFYTCNLTFIGVCVEIFGNRGQEVESSFSNLLSHFTKITCTHIQSVGIPSNPHLITTFFEMVQRYLLFAPAALCRCGEFGLLVSLAVACLTQCGNERESTRSTLTFLTQLIGGKAKGSSHQTSQVLNDNQIRVIIDGATSEYGTEIVKVCLNGLSDSNTSTLNVNFCDCLYAILTHVIGSDINGDAALALNSDGEQLAHSWIHSALLTLKINQILTSEDKNKLVKCILKLCRVKGGSNVGFRKMFASDFGRVCNGEVGMESIDSF